MYYGLNAPFFGGKSVVLSRQEDLKLIRNDLVQLLLTSPGERVMRPDYGSGIRMFLFEGISNESLSDLKRNIEESVEKYEPRVALTDIQLKYDDSLLYIKLFGGLRLNAYYPEVDYSSANLLIELSIPLNGS